jgi:hypothetical protein
MALSAGLRPRARERLDPAGQSRATGAPELTTFDGLTAFAAMVDIAAKAGRCQDRGGWRLQRAVAPLRQHCLDQRRPRRRAYFTALFADAIAPAMAAISLNTSAGSIGITSSIPARPPRAGR